MRGVMQRLASRAGTRQVEAITRATIAQNAVQRCAISALAEMRRAIESRDPASIGRTLRDLPHRLRRVLRRHLSELLVWCHRSARHHLAREVPYHALRWAAQNRGRHGRQQGRRGMDNSIGRHSDTDAGRSVTEEVVAGKGRSRLLGESQNAWSDLLNPFRDDGDTFDINYSLDDLLALLFPAPTLTYAESVVHEGDWEARIKSGSGLADPGAVAHRVAVGLSLGHTPAQIEREIRPAVQNVVSSAKRLARTETMRVAARVQMDMHAGLGDLVVGYQIHATLDERTRPEHRARDGTIYWAQPKAGQLGYDRMPRPPMEADGTPAFNCRCFLVPVLAEPGANEGASKLTPAPAPDQLVYSDWFASTTERKRRLAVGSARYSLVKQLTGEEVPGWEHFTDVDTGKLLPLDMLRDEGERLRGERVVRARAVLALRRAQKKDVVGKGWTK